jgi:hypothetical protein
LPFIIDPRFPGDPAEVVASAGCSTGGPDTASTVSCGQPPSYLPFSCRVIPSLGR